MGRIGQRAIQLVLVVVGVLTLLFVLLRVSGDPVLSLLGPEGASDRGAVERLRHAYGLDEPLYVQFGVFAIHALRLDFGESFVQRRSAMDVVLQRAPASALLALTAMTLATVIGLGLGVTAALARSRLLGTFVTVAAVVGQSVPAFFLALLLILLFSVTFRLLPTFGFDQPSALILPAVSVALLPLARIARLSRASMKRVLNQEFMVTAKAKGLPPRTVLWRHGLKNVMLPILTVIGYDLVQVFGSQAVAEAVFAWPGLGSQLITSAGQRDYPVVLAITFVVTVTAVLVTLLVDFAYEWFDPRVRQAA